MQRFISSSPTNAEASVNAPIIEINRPREAITPGVAPWPLALEAALDRLAEMHERRGVFGINYQRARGFSRALSEALSAPEAPIDAVVERARTGRPLVAPLIVERCPDLERFDSTSRVGIHAGTFALQLEIAAAYEEGLAIARRCLANLAPAERVRLPWLLGREVPRATIYERVFRLVRVVTGAAAA